MDTYTVDKEPICQDEGSQSIHCRVCGAKTASQVIPMTGHHAGEPTIENEVPAGCVTAGSYTESIYCTDCNELIMRDVKSIEPVRHVFGNWYDVTPATCTDNGNRERKCSVCDYIEKQGVDPTGHEPANEYVVDKHPTCTKDGSASLHCNRCGEVLDSKVLTATGHQPETVGAKESTCTETGYSGDIVCSVCGEILEQGRELPVKPHIYRDGSCVNCGAEDPNCHPSDGNPPPATPTPNDTPDYKFVEGAGSTWVQNSSEDLVFRATGDVDKLTYVAIDGYFLSTNKYTVTPGSTIIALKSEYLETLSLGKHTITTHYDDGECSTSFEIIGDANQGDNTTPVPSTPSATIHTPTSANPDQTEPTVPVTPEITEQNTVPTATPSPTATLIPVTPDNSNQTQSPASGRNNTTNTGDGKENDETDNQLTPKTADPFNVLGMIDLVVLFVLVASLNVAVYFIWEGTGDGSGENKNFSEKT